MKVDMSPDEITRRLEAVSQLSRACVELGHIGKTNGLQKPFDGRELEIVERVLGTDEREEGPEPA